MGEELTDRSSDGVGGRGEGEAATAPASEERQAGWTARGDEAAGVQAGADQGEGVGAEGAEQPTAAGAAEPTTAEQPPGREQIDLTESEQFRRWQAARDRERAALQQQLEEARRQQDQAQRELEAVRLQEMEPDERAAYLQQRLEERDARMQQMQQRAQAEAEIREQAQEVLEEAGLDVHHPGLDWSGGPTAVGLERLRASVERVKRLSLEERLERLESQAGQQQRTARQQALQEAGVTQVSTATGGGGGGEENPIREIDDPDELLRLAFG